MGDSHMGLRARLMSQALRKPTAATKRNNTCAIFINQLRRKIGVVCGNPETTTGGNALKFYASVRLDTRKTGVVKSGEHAVSNKTRVKVVKTSWRRLSASVNLKCFTAWAFTPPVNGWTWRAMPA